MRIGFPRCRNGWPYSSWEQFDISLAFLQLERLSRGLSHRHVNKANIALGRERNSKFSKFVCGKS